MHPGLGLLLIALVLAAAALLVGAVLSARTQLHGARARILSAAERMEAERPERVGRLRRMGADAAGTAVMLSGRRAALPQTDAELARITAGLRENRDAVRLTCRRLRPVMPILLRAMRLAGTLGERRARSQARHARSQAAHHSQGRLPG